MLNPAVPTERPQRSVSVCEREKGLETNSERSTVPLQPFFLLIFASQSVCPEHTGKETGPGALKDLGL